MKTKKMLMALTLIFACSAASTATAKNDSIFAPDAACSHVYTNLQTISPIKIVAVPRHKEAAVIIEFCKTQKRYNYDCPTLAAIVGMKDAFSTALKREGHDKAQIESYFSTISQAKWAGCATIKDRKIG